MKSTAHYKIAHVRLLRSDIIVKKTTSTTIFSRQESFNKSTESTWKTRGSERNRAEDDSVLVIYHRKTSWKRDQRSREGSDSRGGDAVYAGWRTRAPISTRMFKVRRSDERASACNEIRDVRRRAGQAVIHELTRLSLPRSPFYLYIDRHISRRRCATRPRCSGATRGEAGPARRATFSH